MSTKENDDEGVVELGKVRRLSTWTRDDRGDLESFIEGITGLTSLAEANLIQEKYGLSVIFHEDPPEYEAVDPIGRYSIRGPTPCAAINLWDMEREHYEKSKRPKADKP